MTFLVANLVAIDGQLYWTEAQAAAEVTLKFGHFSWTMRLTVAADWHRYRHVFG